MRFSSHPRAWAVKQKTQKILKDLVTCFMIIEQCHQSWKLLGSHKATLDGMLISPRMGRESRDMWGRLRSYSLPELQGVDYMTKGRSRVHFITCNWTWKKIQ